MSTRSMLFVLVSMAWLNVAATCTGPAPVTIEADDEDRFIPSGRASVEIIPGHATRRAGSLVELATGSAAEATANAADGGAEASAPSTSPPPPSHRARPVAFTFSLDAAFSAVEGRDRQRVPVDRQIRLGERIDGPAEVDVDAESLHGHVAGRGGVRIADMFSVEAILGLGIDRTEVEVRSGARRFGEGETQPGFLFGGRATFRPVPLVDLYAQSIVNLTSIDRTLTRDGFSREHEVGAELNLTRNLAIFSGYRWWSYREDDMSGGSNVEIDIRGPTAGVSLKF